MTDGTPLFCKIQKADKILTKGTEKRGRTGMGEGGKGKKERVHNEIMYLVM